MDVIELINRRIDIYSLLEKYNAKGVKELNDVIRCACPVHGGNNTSSFVYHLDKKLFYCHSCGASGDAVQLVQDMEKVTFLEAIKILTDMLEIDITDIKIVEKKNRYAKEIELLKKMYKQKRKKVEEFDVSQYDLKLLSEYRDFDGDTLKEFQVSFCKQVDGWKDRIVVPIIENGKVVGISTRRTLQDNSPKWVHFPTGIKTGDLLFNIDNCIEAEEIIICEGMWDTMKWHMAGFKSVCTFGAKLSDEQMNTLIKTGADLILSYDGDDAGQVATKKAHEKLKGKATVYKISYKEGTDAGSLNIVELIKHYNNKTKLI